ncbi:hypothetical protein [Microvirga sp. M2]|uniref:hypothetical protein n=1 Tax=Microvirga sp. M2 TaxID=3073270 RepID=UPI0039C0B23F
MPDAVPAYHDPATVLLYDSDAKLVPGQTLTISLAKAVKLIVEEWSGDQLVDVFIATPLGSIEGIEAIRRLYFRDDFPLERKGSRLPL